MSCVSLIYNSQATTTIKFIRIGWGVFVIYRETKRCLFWTQCTHALCCENKTPFTKQEVHNELHHCQSRTKPRPQVTCTENLVKSGCFVCEICKQTDRRWLQLLRSPAYRRVGWGVLPVAAPRAWNSLPPVVRSSSSLITFRRELETFLYHSSFVNQWFFSLLYCFPLSPWL